jgi:hypothetical protein
MTREPDYLNGRFCFGFLIAGENATIFEELSAQEFSYFVAVFLRFLNIWGMGV